MAASSWRGRRAPGRRRARVAAAFVLCAAVVLTGCADDQPVRESATHKVTLTPARAVRGAALRVTVEGLKEFAGRSVDLTFSTMDATAEIGVASESVDSGGRMDATMTVPSILGHETELTPGKYRLIFLVKGAEGERFDEEIEVIAAALGERYPYEPTYECLEYTRFDGRLWRQQSGSIEKPVEGSTIELSAADRATYVTPTGEQVAYSVADPATFDAETYACPA